MAESLDAFAELAAIRDELEEHGFLIEALLRAQPTLAADLYDAVASDPLLAEIMIAVDAQRSQGEIGEEFRKRKIKGASAGNLSGKFDRLYKDLHLITLIHQRQGKVYRRTRLAEVLGVVRKLEKDKKRQRA